MRATTIFLATVLMLVALPYLAVAQDKPAVDAVGTPSAADATAPTSADAANTTGVAEPTQTPAESCRASCTRSFEVCGDEGTSSDQSMMGRPSAGFSKNHCSSALADCLKGCRGL